MFSISATRFRAVLLGVSLCLGLTGLWNAPAQAQVTAFKQAVAEAAARDRDLAAFYQANDYQPIWTGASDADRARRAALFEAIAAADSHGLPVARYDAEGLMARLKVARSPREAGLAEVEMSRTFLRLAREMQTGALIPSEVDGDIKREVAYRDRGSYLTSLIQSSPRAFFRALPPRSNEYARLMKEKFRLESLAKTGGWGPKVPGEALKPGQSGAAVVALRNRLMAMGFMGRSATQTYDESMMIAVQQFQMAHGLTPDGVAGPGTMAQVNTTVSDRLKSVIVAMERERWLNQELGARHIIVNLTDFNARIIEDGQVAFETRVVVGKNTGDRRSPEFSDSMDHMVINPTWHVPRSIAVKEYLPKMQRNPNAASHLRLYNSRGQQVSRGAVNFNAYSASSFPFCDQAAAVAGQRAWAGEVHVPQQVQHLPARHPRQEPVRARDARLQSWLHPAAETLRTGLRASVPAGGRPERQVSFDPEYRARDAGEPGTRGAGAHHLSHRFHLGQGSHAVPPGCLRA